MMISAEVLIAKRVLSKIAPEIVMDTAFSGEDGLALLRSGRPLPALVLLDLKIPGVKRHRCSSSDTRR